MAAERRYPASEVRGSDERSYPASEDGATAGRSYPTPLHPKPRAAGRRSNPTSKEPWLRGRRRA